MLQHCHLSTSSSIGVNLDNLQVLLDFGGQHVKGAILSVHDVQSFFEQLLFLQNPCQPSLVGASAFKVWDENFGMHACPQYTCVCVHIYMCVCMCICVCVCLGGGAQVFLSRSLYNMSFVILACAWIRVTFPHVLGERTGKRKKKIFRETDREGERKMALSTLFRLVVLAQPASCAQKPWNS